VLVSVLHLGFEFGLALLVWLVRVAFTLGLAVGFELVSGLVLALGLIRVIVVFIVRTISG